MADETIPLAVPSIGQREADMLARCIESGWVSSVGPFVTEFERAVSGFIGAVGGVAVSSGTSALHLALRLAGLGAGEEVIMPALTFIAPANAIRNHGAWPLFVDVAPDTWQMDPGEVRKLLEGCHRRGTGVLNPVTGRRVVGLLPVHLLGNPSPVSELEDIAAEFGLFVVEDAAEALGASYEDGRRVGSKGSFVCLSFNGNKVVTTGGGGMLLSDTKAVLERGRFLSTQARLPGAEYVHTEVGYNYRLTSLQAALGLAQMQRVEEFLATKAWAASLYRELLDGTGVEFMKVPDGVFCSWWLPTVLLPRSAHRDRVMGEMAAWGVEVRPLWQPLHRSVAMNGAYALPCPVSDEVQARALSLPASVTITAAQVGRVAELLKRAVRGT